MGIKTTPVEPHWNYLLALERDLEKLSRYVEFDAHNFTTFSLEIARILLAAGAEVDVVCKQLCLKLEPTSTADNILAYQPEVLAKHAVIPAFEVTIPRFGLSLRPWDEWSKPKSVPFWWTAYNKIKHHRNAEYQRANLHNALNAVGGLFVVVLYLYRERAATAELLPALQLLRPGEVHFGGVSHNGHEFGVNYVL